MKQNRWGIYNIDKEVYESIVISATRPSEDHSPIVNMRRVRGHTYQYYSLSAGSHEWVKAANRILESHSRSNFERGR